MEVIVAESSGGKTTELIQRSAETGAVIVCTNVAAQGNILRLAFSMGVKIPDPVTYSKLVTHGYNRNEHKNGILIDDLDCMINDIFGNNVIAATFRDEMRTPDSDVFFRRIK